MENAVPVSETNWKEVGITAGIVIVGGFLACIAAVYAHDKLKDMAAKKAAKKDETKK